MGGKKKNLATKLAKMSDEERIKYMQRKSEIEEEAKRRKQQLIAIFMKNKIKKEDAFSRLNLAKINQQWHQILRQNKCNEMKTNIQDFRNRMDRILSYKNRIIEKLLEELESMEELYSNNFQSHCNHINKIIESQNVYMKSIQEQYQKDLSNLIDISSKESKEIIENSKNEEKHLKTIIYVIQTNKEKEEKDNLEDQLLNQEITKKMFRIELIQIQREKINKSIDIWRQIAEIIQCYIKKNDKRRMHMAELKRSNAISAEEIVANKETIKQRNTYIKELKVNEENLKVKYNKYVESLQREITNKNKKFLYLKNHLIKITKLDNKIIKNLSGQSNQIIDILSEKFEKVNRIKNLLEICQKYESEKEKIDKLYLFSFEIDEKDKKTIKKRQHTAPILKRSKYINVIEKRKSNSAIVKNCKNEEKPNNILPKIKIKHKKEQNPHKDLNVIKEKNKSLTCIIVDSICKLENFWEIYARVNVAYHKLKEEKRFLLNENIKLRNMIKAVLEANVLSEYPQNMCIK